MRSLCLALMLLFAIPATATAHRLKLFATLEGNQVSGYVFFIASGRARGASIVIRDAKGVELWRGVSDEKGRFSWMADKPDDLTLTANAGDGHIASAHIARSRFDPNVAEEQGAHRASTPIAGLAGPAAPAACDPAATQAAIQQAVDLAVARQIRPLLEAYDAADGRLRFNDIVGGIGMIVGLAGIAMWLSARRRNPRPPPSQDGSP